MKKMQYSMLGNTEGRKFDKASGALRQRLSLLGEESLASELMDIVMLLVDESSLDEYDLLSLGVWAEKE